MPKRDTPKPRKPRPDFPLFPHATKRWAKKIRGKMHYFGPWDNPDGALKKYLRERDYLQAGMPVPIESNPENPAVLTVKRACNLFLESKQRLVDAGELSPRTWDCYHFTCRKVVKHLGSSRPVVHLTPDDFERFRAALSKTNGSVTLATMITRTRVLFKYCHDSKLIPRPVDFGPSFKKPSKRTMRQARQARGPRLLERDELLAVLDKAEGQLKAMILLGIQAGFGATDCASLPKVAVDLDAGWIDFPRPKTAVARRVPLWPETIEALRGVMEQKRKSARDPEHEELVFLSRTGQPWVRTRRVQNPKPDKPEWSTVDSIGLMFGRLLSEMGIKRPGLSFYALRHSFETYAGESRDQVAVDAVMGHDPGDMASLYRERISDERLRGVVDHVRHWLWPTSMRSPQRRPLRASIHRARGLNRHPRRKRI